MRGAESDRDGKIGAHPHRKQLQAIAARDFGCQREMRRRRFGVRRNAHQPRNDQAMTVAAGGKKAIGVLWQDAGFLRLRAGIDLHEAAPMILATLL